MGNVTIRGKHVGREVVAFLICVLLVTLWNAYAIHKYDTSWTELYTLWYVVLPVSLLLYVVLIPFRFLFCRIGMAVRGNRSRKNDMYPRM